MMSIEFAGLKLEKLEPIGRPREHPILFIHGSGGGAWSWENYLDFFSSKGYTCYAPNLRGCPESKPVVDIGRVSIHDHVADVMEVIQEIGNPILIGHSLGGLIAQKLAERFDPPAVVAISSAPPRGVFIERSFTMSLQLLRHLSAILFGRPIRPSLSEAVRLVLNRIPRDQQKSLFTRGLPQSGRLFFEIGISGVPVDSERVKCPVLMIGAGDDRLVPAKISKKIALKYEADYLEYPEFAHMIILEPGWERVAKDIVQWLNRVASTRQDSDFLPHS